MKQSSWNLQGKKALITGVTRGIGRAIDDASGAPYGMSKAAMIQLGKHLAVEWARDNIRINTIAPWYIETELTKPALSNPEKFFEVF